jgi:polysaccharide pyruvyl transferase CsaB
MIFRSRGPKIVISGYYGFDNTGDEAVLMSIIHCLLELRPDARIVVLSENPEKTRATYGVKAVNRWSPFEIAWELMTCRLLISGGGSLIQDVTSARSPIYYLSVILAATLLGKKTMIYGQGVGPLAKESNRARTAKVFNKCHAITVRDSQSAELLKELGVVKDIQVACDPVMALSYEDVDREDIREYLADMNILDSMGRKRKPLLLVAIRSWKDDKHMQPVAEFLDAQARVGWDVLLAPAQFPRDMEAIDKVANMMTERMYCLGKGLAANQFLALTAYADRVFSMRLHGLVFAMAMGVPMLGLSYDPKVDAFMDQAGLERYCMPYDDFDWETAGYLLEEIESLPLELRQRQETRRQEMQEAAWDMARKAVALLSASDGGDEAAVSADDRAASGMNADAASASDDDAASASGDAAFALDDHAISGSNADAESASYADIASALDYDAASGSNDDAVSAAGVNGAFSTNIGASGSNDNAATGSNF